MIELNDFQRWLTREKQMTPQQALEICQGDDHHRYIDLFREWEANRKPPILVCFDDFARSPQWVEA